MKNAPDTSDRLEVGWSFTFASTRVELSSHILANDGAAEAEGTSSAYRSLARALECAAARHGAHLTRSVVRAPIKSYRLGGGLTESVVQVLGAVGGVAGIAGLLKDFLPILRDWKKSNRNLSVTLKRNGTEISVSGAQTSVEASDLLKASVLLATRKLPATSTKVDEGRPS
jgi:hypothetical protein